MNTVEKINRTLHQARLTDLYRNKLDSSLSKIEDVAEITRLPLTTKSELREAYPYGGLALKMDKVVECHMSSGTTGEPVVSFYSQLDLDRSNAALGKAWANFGITADSKVQFIMSYGLFSGAPLNTYAIQSLGAFVLPAGIQHTSRQAELIRDFGIDTIVATPSFYLHLFDHMKKDALLSESFPLKRGIVAGEPCSPALKAKISEIFGIRLFDHHGLCEINTGIIYECHVCGRMAVLDEQVYAEVIDPESGEPVKDGILGELVLTTLEKEASPVVRYRTGDMTALISRSSDCGACRSRTVLGRFHNRLDSTIFYKGIKLQPHELRDAIFGFLGGRVLHYLRLSVPTDVYKGKIRVNICSPDDNAGIKEVLQNYLKDKTGITFEVGFYPESYFLDATATKEKLVEYYEP